MIEFTSEAIWSWAFVCWEVFDDLFNFLTSICSVQTVSSWLSPRRLYVSRNLFISSRLSNLLAYNCSWKSLTILWVSLLLTSLSFLAWVLSFFLGESSYRLVIFAYLFQESALTFLFVSIWFISTLIFVNSFLLLTLGCVCSFLVSWAIKIMILLVFLDSQTFIAKNFFFGKTW